MTFITPIDTYCDHVTPTNRYILILSACILVLEVCALLYFHLPILQWLEHAVLVAAIPFIQSLIKYLLTLKLMQFLKAGFVFLGHLSKLGLLKLFKTLGLRYGLFFLQRHWRFIRLAKVVFLRKGKQFFRALIKFWRRYTCWQQSVVLVAFLPLILTLFLLGLSFNITRKTMVHKTQEAAMVKIAATASIKNHGIRAKLQEIDKKTLESIRKISAKENKNKR